VYSFVRFGGSALKRELFCEPSGRQVGYTISRRRVFKLLSGIIAYGALVSIPGVAAWAQVPANPSNSIQGPAIATREQAVRWLSTNGAQDLTYDWVGLAWMWGEAVGIRPDLMLAQEMLETGWGRFGGIVAP
jgi:hypothetical protein